jgi:hypothetical protein
MNVFLGISEVNVQVRSGRLGGGRERAPVDEVDGIVISEYKQRKRKEEECKRGFREKEGRECERMREPFHTFFDGLNDKLSHGRVAVIRARISKKRESQRKREHDMRREEK